MSKTLENKKPLDDALAQGEIISLFAEGTTNEGQKLLPFKSSLLSMVEHTTIAVQPVSIVYTHLNGEPLNLATLARVGWFGEAEFFPHVVAFLKEKNVDVTLVFHPSVPGNAFASRKELALYCREQVEKPFITMLPGVYSGG